MYNIMYEMTRQSRFDAQYWMLGAGALGRPRGRVWGGRREEGSGWGTHVYLWQIHFNIWQNQYNIVKFKNKIKLKKNHPTCSLQKCDPSFIILLCVITIFQIVFNRKKVLYLMVEEMRLFHRSNHSN